MTDRKLPNKIGEVIINGETLNILRGEYFVSGNTAIMLQTQGNNPEPYATFSCYLEGLSEMLSEDEFFVKDWSENEHLVEPMMGTGLFERTELSVITGYVESEAWRIVE